MQSFGFILIVIFNVVIGLLFVLVPRRIVYIMKAIRRESFFWQENSSDKLWISDSATKNLVRFLGVVIIIFSSFVFYIVLKYGYHWIS